MGPVFGYKMFTYNADTKTFVAEISELPNRSLPAFFEIQGKMTNISLVHKETVKDCEGDTICWIYESTPNIKAGPGPYFVHIMND